MKVIVRGKVNGAKANAATAIDRRVPMARRVRAIVTVLGLTDLRVKVIARDLTGRRVKARAPGPVVRRVRCIAASITC